MWGWGPVVLAVGVWGGPMLAVGGRLAYFAYVCVLTKWGVYGKQSLDRLMFKQSNLDVIVV